MVENIDIKGKQKEEKKSIENTQPSRKELGDGSLSGGIITARPRKPKDK